MFRLLPTVAVSLLMAMSHLAAIASAVNISINNPSFETLTDSGNSPYSLPLNHYATTHGTNLTNLEVHNLSNQGPIVATGIAVAGGWTTTDTNSSGVYAPDNSLNLLNITNVNGANVGYLNAIANTSQTLPSVLQAGTYVLTANIGYPSGSFAGANTASGNLQLRVGGTEVATPIASGSVGVGTLATLSRTYSISPGNSLIGGALSPTILKTGGGASLYFDSFSLTYTPPAAITLNDAIASWQFASFETLGDGTAGSGTTLANRNKTGTSNDVRDLNGNQSWLTRYFNGSANAATTGNAILATDVQAANTDLKSLDANSGANYLIRNLGTAGEELIPTTNTSYTVFARVYDPQFQGIDDIFRVGDWSSASNNYYALQTNNGVARFVIRGAGQVADSILEGPTLSANTWYDITGVFDSLSQTMTLYVYDPKTGLQVGSTVVLSSLGFSSLAAGSAAENTRNGGMFFSPGFANGQNTGARADLVAVWNQALMQSDVAALSAVPEPSALFLSLISGTCIWRTRRRTC